MVRDIGTQTISDEFGLIPIPMPTTVPVPFCMYKCNVPLLVPIPVLMPYPVFLPISPEKFGEFCDQVQLMDGVIRSNENEELYAQKRMISSNHPEPSINGPSIPIDHKHNSTLGARLFNDFVAKLHSEDASIPRSFTEHTAKQLCETLLRFISQLKKSDGSPCSPEALYFVCIGIHYYLQLIGREEDIFYDKEFNAFSSVLFDRIQHSAIQIDLRNNSIYSTISEPVLWKTRMLGAHSPRILLNTLFYLNIKCFLIRGIKDHYDLTFANVRRHVKRWVLPVETNAGKEQILENKMSESEERENQRYREMRRQRFIRYYPTHDPDLIFEQMEDRSFSVHCACHIFEFYVARCPVHLRHSNQCLYLEPEKSVCPESPIWFSAKTVSNLTLKKMALQTRMVKEMSELEVAFATNCADSMGSARITGSQYTESSRMTG
ncbi:hypothetical protein ACOME3_007349 [Neoechinorhynchus agilis]